MQILLASAQHHVVSSAEARLHNVDKASLCVVQTELSSFLMEITSLIFGRKDDQKEDGWLLDVIKDQTGMKGTGALAYQPSQQQNRDMGTPCNAIAIHP